MTRQWEAAVRRRWNVQAREHGASDTGELATRHWAYHAALAELQGRRSAVYLYQSLAAGYLPPILPTASPDGAAVHLDVVLHCASWGSQGIEYQQVLSFAVGSLPLVTASFLGAAVTNKRSRLRAEAAAQPRWLDHGVLRFFVTPTATWCGRGNDWRQFAHSAITGYELDSEACSIALTDAPPLRLTGPGAWSHAVLVAYWRYGADGLLQAPFLEPVRRTASQRPAPVMG